MPNDDKCKVNFSLTTPHTFFSLSIGDLQVEIGTFANFALLHNSFL